MIGRRRIRPPEATAARVARRDLIARIEESSEDARRLAGMIDDDDTIEDLDPADSTVRAMAAALR